MMAELTLDVRKNSLIGPNGSQSIDLGAVARIKRLDAYSPEQSVAVNIGKETRITGLDAGEYEIQVHLPSGAVISQEVVIKRGLSKPVEFDATGAPEDFLGWQHLAGAVLSRNAALMAIDKLSNLDHDVSTERFTAEDSDREVTYRAVSGRSSSKPSVLMIRSPNSRQDPLVNRTKVKAVWKALSQGVAGKVKPVTMVGGFFQDRVPVKAQASGREIWQFGLADGDFDTLRPPRTYVLVATDDTFELACLPLPWQIELFDQKWRSTEFVDVLVDNTAQIKPVRTSIMVRDQKYAGLVGFMNNGALGLANELLRSDGVVVETALDLLEQKARNPLGACAAAYVLLSTSSFGEAEQQSWFTWIENLGTNPLYGWIPDAAIIYARVKLMGAECEAQAREAIPYLHLALRGGLPFYSLGLTWLIETMTHFRDSDPLIKSLFKEVDSVARYLDVNQAFLVLKFGATR